MNYNGSLKVKAVTGYNETYILFEYGENDAKLWNNVIVSGNLITLIIPPRGSLDITFQTTYGSVANGIMSGNINNQIYTREFRDDTIYDILMSSDYPIPNFYNDVFKRKTVTCLSGFANFNITIVYADLRNGILQFNYSTTSKIYENRIVTNELLSFTADEMTISAGSYKPWNGFLLRYEASYVNEEKTNKIIFIIVGSFAGIAVISLVAIGILIYYLRKKGKEKQRLEGICDILTNMQMTKDDLIGYKEKTDELFIKDSNIFINFDKILGQGSCSSVYYGFLKGPSPLHLKMQMIETQRFGDCDVAVKVARNIGKNELEQLYKEITVMKTLGYH
uniref:Protein kinase domain-containing protein n=1 Tax=Acrobeloides nanus TaxID=290746 RepID=A0A914CYJ8_9BILA